MEEQVILDEAIHNMQTQFTVLGLMEELQMTHTILGLVFPWLAGNS